MVFIFQQPFTIKLIQKKFGIDKTVLLLCDVMKNQSATYFGYWFWHMENPCEQ